MAGLFAPLFGPLTGGGVSDGYSAEAQALFARFTTSPSDARKALINTRILAAKASGAWDVRDAFYMMAAADAQAGQRNWKADTFNLTPAGTIPFDADRGYTGDGVTGYLGTGFVPSAAGGRFTLNSAHLSVWSRTSAQSAGAAIGARDGTNLARSLIIARNTSNLASVGLNQTSLQSNIASTDGSGGFVMRRSGAAANALFRNGASLGADTITSSTRTSFEIVIGAMNTAGVIGNFCNYQLASAGIGGNLTNAQILAEYNADLAYLQGVGAA